MSPTICLRRATVAISMVAISVSACFEQVDPDDDGREVVDISGQWEGTWTRETATGALTMTLVQDGSALVGTAAFRDSPCVTSGDVDGTIVSGDFVGNMTVEGGKVLFSGTQTGNEMHGTFDLAIEGMCNGLSGTFQVDRNSGA